MHRGSMEAKPKKILIIEDDLCFNIILTSILKDYTLCTSTSFPDALKYLDEVDFVVTDYDFPGGGFPVLKPHLLERKKKYILQSAVYRMDASEYLIANITKNEIVKSLTNLLPLISLTISTSSNSN